MKIVLTDVVTDIPGHSQGSFSGLLWDLASNLKSLGEDVHIIGAYTSKDYPNKEIPVHLIKPSKIRYKTSLAPFLAALRAVWKIREIGNVDIIHSFEYQSPCTFGILIKNIPIILTAAVNIFEKVESGVNPYPWPTTQVYKISTLCSARLCSHIVVLTEEMKRWWKSSGVTDSNISVIPNGLNFEVFKRINNARKQLGIDADTKVLLYVGILKKEKGVEYLLQAIKEIKDLEHLRLNIVGDGPLRRYTEHFIKKHNLNAEVFGWIRQQDLPVYYSAADALVLPSLSEVTPRVIDEAMACKTPVIATDVGGISNRIIDGETGFLIPPKNANALRLKIFEVLQDRESRKKVSENAYNHVKNNIDWKIIANRYISEVYSRFL